MSRAARTIGWAWPYAAAAVVLAGLVPLIPFGAQGTRPAFALAVPLALGVLSAIAAARHPALQQAWVVPAVSIVAIGISALAYSAPNLLEALVVTAVATVTGALCAAGWVRMSEDHHEERSQP